MMTYPENGTCSGDFPNSTLCGPEGYCLPGRALCLCPLYMNPLTDCRDPIFKGIEGEAQAFAIVCSIVTILIGLAFLYELAKDFQGLKKPLKSPVVHAKFGIIAYCFVKLARVAFWGAGLDEMTARYALAEKIAQVLAISIFGAAYMLSSYFFFALLLKAKKFDGAKPRELRIIRNFILVMIFTFIPAIITMMILEAYGVGVPLIKTISSACLMIMLGIVFLIMFVYIVRIFIWFNREKEIFSASTRLQSLRRKTIIVTSLTIWLILTSLIIPMTGDWGEDLPDVIMARSWITFFNEASGIIFMFFFLENQLTQRITYVSSETRSKSTKDTKDTKETKTGSSLSSDTQSP